MEPRIFDVSKSFYWIVIELEVGCKICEESYLELKMGLEKLKKQKNKVQKNYIVAPWHLETKMQKIIWHHGTQMAV